MHRKPQFGIDGVLAHRHLQFLTDVLDQFDTSKSIQLFQDGIAADAAWIWNSTKRSACAKRASIEIGSMRTSSNPASTRVSGVQFRLTRTASASPVHGARAAPQRAPRRRSDGDRVPARHTATRPPGASARRISATAAGLSTANCSPCWLTTRSKPPSGKGSDSDRPTCHSMVTPSRSAAWQATASIAGLMSRPTTLPSGPTSGAIRRATAPVPHPTSSTYVPA